MPLPLTTVLVAAAFLFALISAPGVAAAAIGAAIVHEVLRVVLASQPKEDQTGEYEIPAKLPRRLPTPEESF